MPKRPQIAPAKPPKPLEITITQATPTPTPKSTAIVLIPKPTPPRETILSDGLQKTDTEDKNAQFESDQNLVAGSLLPAMGNVPLPSQQGIKRPYTQFQNRRYTPGEKPAESSPASRPQSASEAQQTAQAARQAQQQAEKRIAKVVPTPSATPITTPRPTPPPTPTPTADRLFALGKPTPIPVPEQPQLRQQMAMLRPSQANPGQSWLSHAK
ncbi:MAG: hypothetical protein QM796_09510 [Chthoniobacteraceae bacterium]